MAKEYIEREALREVVNNLRLGRHLNKDAALNLMERAIDNLPPADVVEVVRCKDCVYFEEDYVYAEGFVLCPAIGMEVTDMDFCSYGERRDSDG